MLNLEPEAGDEEFEAGDDAGAGQAAYGFDAPQEAYDDDEEEEGEELEQDPDDSDYVVEEDGHGEED